MPVLARQHVAAMPEVEVDDPAPMHRRNGLLELAEECIREPTAKRPAEQDTGAVFEDDRLVVDPAEELRNAGHSGQAAIGAHLAVDETPPDQSSDPLRATGEVLEHDRALSGLHAEDVRVPTPAATERLARAPFERAPIDDGAGDRAHGNTAARSQKSAAPPPTARSVPSSLFSS